MYFDETVYHMHFKNSDEKRDIPLSRLGHRVVDFLEHYGNPYLLGQDFCELIGHGDGETKFQRLLEATGYENDPRGFFFELTEKLGNVGSRHAGPLKIKGVELPNLLWYAVLGTVVPGNRFISIKDVDQFEKLANITVPQADRDDLQEVIETYPVRLSMHTLRQMRISRHVAYQYAPFVEELDPVGQINTWIGQFHDGLLERMYRNRVIFLLNMTCPVYCRFCFRKHKDLRNQANPTEEDVRKAVEYVNQSPTIKEIVITGGDPFLNKKNMMAAIDGLKEVPHVKTLRLATRSISYYPHLFYDNDDFWLNYVKIKNLELQQVGKRLEVATHFIHPDEISLESLDIISELVRNGIAVYVQTPFLKDCNDEGPELTRLFRLLRGAGAELHYIYIPCSPIHGNSVYWTPISKGHRAAHYLRAHLSDRIIPRLCTATPIGKIDWHSSGWAVEQDPENDRFIWIRTPYTPDYFKAFAEKVDKQDVVRINEEGTLDARFMAQIGDEALFLGSRKPKPVKKVEVDQAEQEKIRALALQDQRIPVSIVPTGSPTLFRIHETRVEMHPAENDRDISYIEGNRYITDVVIASKNDAIENLHRIGQIIKRLQEIPHVNAVRLRSLKFNHAPDMYTRAVVDKLGELNHLTVANPLRLEIETQFLRANEIKPEHEALVRALRNHGITIYCNTPLFAGINDSADEMHDLAHVLRDINIEFHHMYVAGLPVQRDWSETRPVDIADVIDIASRVRRDGSGREIPRYIILTELGEVDFGLNGKMFTRDADLFVKLLPYEHDYYKAMYSGFQWPAHTEVDEDGRPVVKIRGLICSDGFFIS